METDPVQPPAAPVQGPEHTPPSDLAEARQRRATGRRLISRWLRRAPTEEDDDGTRVEQLTADPDVTDAEVTAYLGREIRRNYAEPEEVAQVLDELGVGSLAKYLRENKFPTQLHVRHGEFGEVLAGAIFRHARRYAVPILKLRYKHDRNQPVRGADNLAFRLRMSPPVVAVVEVKTRSTRRLDIGEKACDDVDRRVRDGLGPAISFVYARVVKHNPALATRILALLDGPKEIERHVVIVHDENQWRDEILTRLRGAAKGTTEATIIRLRELRELIQKAFDRAGDDLAR